jgi:protein O-mannosyl-transferase
MDEAIRVSEKKDMEEEFSFKKFFVPLTTVKVVHWLVIIGLAVYFKSLFNGFVWDDADQIVNNPLILHPSNIPYFFTHSTFYTGGAQSALSGLYYRPVMMVLFAAIASLWGLSPFAFHLVSVVLHIINSILVYFFMKKLFEIQKYRFSMHVSFVAAVLFLVHPANVESVAYISATSEVLYTFFLLIALLATISYGIGEKYTAVTLFIIFSGVTLSLFSKESGLLSILFSLLLAFFFFREKLKMLLIPNLLGCGLYCFFRFFLADLSAPQNNVGLPIAKASLSGRLLTLPYELFSYLRITFFPKDLHISQAYIVTSATAPKFYIPLVVVLLVVAGSLVFIFKARSKLLYFFTLWIFFALGLVLNIIMPLDFTVAERWLYLPLIGFFGIIALFLSHILSRGKKFQKKIAIGIVIIAAIAFSIRTIVRTLDWQNSLTLYRHDITLSRDSFELYTNYGSVLYNAGDIADSQKAYEKAIQLEPDDLWGLNDLGSIYANQGEYKKAIPLYQKSMSIAPSYASYENLAEIYYLTKKPQQVIPVIEKYLIVFPDSAKLNQLAALEYNALGKTDIAKVYARKSAQLDPSSGNIAPIMPLLR